VQLSRSHLSNGIGDEKEAAAAAVLARRLSRSRLADLGRRSKSRSRSRSMSRKAMNEAEGDELSSSAAAQTF
jgi:hypothetical protein